LSSNLSDNFVQSGGVDTVRQERQLLYYININKMLSYRRETALQGALCSFGQKWQTGTGKQYFMDIIDLSSTTVT